VGIDERENRIYGTEENLSISNNKIYNVTGAYNELKKVVENPDVIIENKQNYMNMANKLGDLHVYADGRQMKYEHMK
jgi:aspartyl/asparaginyl beta-hydroxylase (cupin superfamily)